MELYNDESPIQEVSINSILTNTFFRMFLGILASTITAFFLHTVVWLDGDGSVLDSATCLARDPEPVTLKIPRKASDAEHNYSFESWDEGTVDGIVKTYRPVFEQTEKTVYTVWVGSGTADPKHAKEGKLITLTPYEPDEGMYFTGWRVVSGGVTVTDNTFIMPEGNVEIYAVYDWKKQVDL